MGQLFISLYFMHSSTPLQALGVMVFNATFNNISVIYYNSGSQFYWWRKPEYPEKPLTRRKSLTNFITYGVSSTPHLSRI